MLPQNIMKLIEQRSEKIQSNIFTLETRKGVCEHIEQNRCLDSDAAAPVIKYWAGFHSRMLYRNFEEFYSKEKLCDNLPRL